jgi:hypothetical protein
LQGSFKSIDFLLYCIKTVMQTVLMSRIVKVWNISHQFISRSNRLIVKQGTLLVNNLLFSWKEQQRCSAVRNKLMLEILSLLQSAKQFRMVQLEKKMQCGQYRKDGFNRMDSQTESSKIN